MFTTVLNLSASLDRRDSVGDFGLRRWLLPDKHRRDAWELGVCSCPDSEADRLRNAKITYGTQSVALRRVDDVAAVCRPAGSHVGVEALFFIDVGDGFTQFLQLRLQMLAFFGKDFLTFRYR